MGSLLATVILVLPGMAAYYLYRFVGPLENRTHSDYERTIVGLLYNGPGLLIAWGALSIGHHKQLSMTEFDHDILRMPCFLIYIVLVFLMALITSALWEKKVFPSIEKQINKSRDNNQRPQIFRDSAWEFFFGPDEAAILGIYKLGQRDKMVIGQVARAFRPGDQEKGVTLITTSELEGWGYWLGAPERTYLDIPSGTVFEFYPTSAWTDAKRRAAEHVESNPSPSEGAEEEA